MEMADVELVVERPGGMVVEGLAFGAVSDSRIREAVHIWRTVVIQVRQLDAMQQSAFAKKLKAPVYRPDVVFRWLPFAQNLCDVAALEYEMGRERLKHCSHCFAVAQGSPRGRACH